MEFTAEYFGGGDVFTAEWFPYYFERFEKSDKVAMMSLAEEGAYHRSIRLAWKEQTIPADPKVLAAKLQKRCTDKVAAAVLATFEPVPGNPSRMYHRVLEEIRLEQRLRYERRSRGGKASAKARSVNGANKGELNNTEYCSNNTQHIEIEIEKEDKNVCVNAGEVEFVDAALSQIRSRLKVNILPKEHLWSDAAVFAMVNGLSVAEFVECYDLLKQQAWRKGPVTPDVMQTNLVNLDGLRTEIATQFDPKPNGRDAGIRERARVGAHDGTTPKMPKTWKCDECLDFGYNLVPGDGFGGLVEEPCRLGCQKKTGGPDMSHRYDPWRRRYAPRTRPTLKTAFTKDLETTRHERRKATTERIDRRRARADRDSGNAHQARRSGTSGI